MSDKKAARAASKAKKEAVERKKINLSEKYAQKVAAYFAKYPLSYYSDVNARAILTKAIVVRDVNIDTPLREAEAALVLPRIRELLMEAVKLKEPGWMRAKGIRLGAAPHVEVTE
jgi:hypothetical protein